MWSERYSDTDYSVTLDSSHEQSSLWPEYMAVDHSRILIIERSKNANLVTYYAKLSDDETRLHRETPVHGQWESFGWTDEFRIGELSWTQRKLAYGYDVSINEDGVSFEVRLSALPSRPTTLRLVGGKPQLEMNLNGRVCQLIKLYVKSTEMWGILPTVNYVDLYGIDLATGEQIMEKITP